MEETEWSRQSKKLGIRQLESILKRIKDSSLADKEKEDLVRFKEFKEAEGKKPQTIGKVLQTLYLLRIGSSQKDAGITKPVVKVPYHTLDTEDADKFMKIIKGIEELDLSQRTKAEDKKAFITFIKFLDGMRKSRPRGLEFVKINTPKPFIDATKLLTFEDVKQIALRQSNPMMKALVWFAFETGARSSEIISMRVSDISFNENLIHVRIPQTKTTTRQFDIRDSKKALMEWLLIHPERDNKEAPLFIKPRGKMKEENGKKRIIKGKIEPLHMADLRNCLVRSELIAKGKNTTPKWWRKAGICDMIRRRKIDNPYFLMKMVGHVNIETAQNYINFTDEQLSDYLKEKYGLKKKEDLKDYNNCKLCGSLISPEEKVCSNCNYSPNTTFNELRRKDEEKIELILKELVDLKEGLIEHIKSCDNPNYTLSKATPEAGFEPALPGGK